MEEKDGELKNAQLLWLLFMMSTRSTIATYYACWMLHHPLLHPAAVPAVVGDQEER